MRVAKSFRSLVIYLLRVFFASIFLWISLIKNRLFAFPFRSKIEKIRWTNLSPIAKKRYTKNPIEWRRCGNDYYDAPSTELPITKNATKIDLHSPNANWVLSDAVERKNGVCFGLKCKRSLNPTIKIRNHANRWWKIVYIAAKWQSGNVYNMDLACVCAWDECMCVHAQWCEAKRATNT